MASKRHHLSRTEAFSLIVLLTAVFLLYAFASIRPVSHIAETNLASLPGEGPDVRGIASLDYDIGDIRTGRLHVPRLFLATMPESYFEIETIPGRKREFLRILLPLVLLTNEQIQAERRHLLEILALRASAEEIPASAKSWLDALMTKYEVQPGNFKTLLRRVDTVSPAVTLSQAIEETGWGRSRFVRQGNAVFGERTWTKGRGIVPKRRPKGGRYEVRRFETLLESVQAYALNLNTHEAYFEYRVMRAELRGTGRYNPAELAGTLLAYSERGSAYTDAIQRVIRDNQLHQFETAKLTDVAPPTQVAFRVADSF